MFIVVFIIGLATGFAFGDSKQDTQTPEPAHHYCQPHNCS